MRRRKQWNEYLSQRTTTEISAGSTLEAIIIDITGSPIPVGLAVAVNYEVITRSAWSLTVLEEDDEIEILLGICWRMMNMSTQDPLQIGDLTLSSRVFFGNISLSGSIYHVILFRIWNRICHRFSQTCSCTHTRI